MTKLKKKINVLTDKMFLYAEQHPSRTALLFQMILSLCALGYLFYLANNGPTFRGFSNLSEMNYRLFGFIFLFIVQLLVICFYIVRLVKYCFDKTNNRKASLTMIMKSVFTLIMLFAIIYFQLTILDALFWELGKDKWNYEDSMIKGEFEEGFAEIIEDQIKSYETRRFYSFNGFIESNELITRTVEDSIIHYGLNTSMIVYHFVDNLYYSVATITTVGYGDVFPIGIIPKLFCMIELIIGQFLLIFGVGVAFQKNT